MRNRAGLLRDHRNWRHPEPDRFSEVRAALLARARALAQLAAYYLLEPVEVPVRPTRIPITRRGEHSRP